MPQEGQPGGMASTPPADTGPDSATLLQQLVDAAQAEAARQQAAAQGAQGAYQSAQAAPTPNIFQMHPVQLALMQGLSRISSGLQGGTRRPIEDLQAGIQSKQDELRQKRMATLQSLHDDYMQKAEQARKAYDKEGEIKAMQAADRAAKEHDKLMTQSAENVANIAARSREQVAQTRAAAAKSAAETKNQPVQGNWDNYSKLTKTSPSGRAYINIGHFIGKERNAVAKLAAANGVVPLDSNEAGQMDDLKIAHYNVDDILNTAHRLLPQNAMQRAQQFPQRTFSKVMQTSPERAAFGAWRAAAIRNLRAMAGSKGLRINQSEIILALENDLPTLNDTWDTAQKKMEDVKQQLNNVERAFMESSSITPVEGEGGGTASTVTLYRNGKPYYIPSEKVADAIKTGGFKRAP